MTKFSKMMAGIFASFATSVFASDNSMYRDESGDNDSDELGDIPDIDDDNDGISDVAENVFITFYKDHKISIKGAGGKTGKRNSTARDPKRLRGVGKWKIRKKVVGGADASKVKIVGGEPKSNSKKINSLMPWEAQLSSWKLKNGMPLIGAKGLGTSETTDLSREPKPPAKTSNCILKRTLKKYHELGIFIISIILKDFS